MDFRLRAHAVSYPLSGKHSQMRPLKRVFQWSQVLMSTKMVNLSSHLFIAVAQPCAASE